MVSLLKILRQKERNDGACSLEIAGVGVSGMHYVCVSMFAGMCVYVCTVLHSKRVDFFVNLHAKFFPSI